MDERASRTQEVLEVFKKTVEEMTKGVVAQKKHDMDLQIETLRQEVKDLREAASASEPHAPSPLAVPISIPSSKPQS